MNSNSPKVDRGELIGRLVLNIVGDGYQDLKRIKERVTDDGTLAGMSISEVEITSTLLDLIANGLASAFRLFPSEEPPEAVQGVPELADLNKYYFLITDKGLALHGSEYKHWPFDDDGNPRKDWAPPGKTEEKPGGSRGTA